MNLSTRTNYYSLVEQYVGINLSVHHVVVAKCRAYLRHRLQAVMETVAQKLVAHVVAEQSRTTPEFVNLNHFHLNSSNNL